MSAFEFFIIQHSHIDIGYTERQERIAEYQADFIRQAVDFALSEKQETRPVDALFKFTCEGFWAVEQYFNKYGEKGRERFIEAVRKGYLELSPFYGHLAELLDYGHIKESLQFTTSFAREHNLKLNSAMASDINGFSWGMAEALHEIGIENLVINLNSHHGGNPLDRPLKAFYWETHKGNKLLVWNGIAYHKANLLGLIPGMNPAGDPGIPGMIVEDDMGVVDVKDITVAERRIFQLLDSLKAQNYEYNFMPIMGSGLYTDNSPVTEDYLNIINEWNEKYGNKVHLQTGTLEEFFQYVKDNVKEIPTYAGDWNDWWTDGVMSTPQEIRVFRNAQRNKRMIELLDPEHKIVSKDELTEITKNLICYSEHTWGHSASFWQPWKLLVYQLQARKAKFAVDADVLSSRGLDRVYRALGEREFTVNRVFEYKIINPVDVDRRVIAYLPVDFWEVGLFDKGYRVRDAAGNEYKCQHTHTLRGWTVAVELDMKAKQEVLLELLPAETRGQAPEIKGDTYENDYYKISWDSNGIRSIINKSTGNEILNDSGEALGMPVYSLHPGGQRHEAAGFGHSARKIPRKEEFKGSVKNIAIAENGPVFTTLRAEYEIKGASLYRVFFTFYSGLNKIDMTVEMTKDLVTDPEGMYTAFPFQVEDGLWYIDKPGALILPGRDQLPGTCCDYYPVQNGVILSGSKEGVAINMLDAPLVTIGSIKMWYYTKTIDPKGTLYSWLCNNKWETNFRLDMSGFYESRYTIEISKDYTNTDAALKDLKNNNYGAVVLRK